MAEEEVERPRMAELVTPMVPVLFGVAAAWILHARSQADDDLAS